MIEHDDLAILYGKAQAAYDILDPISRRLTRKVADLKVYPCNAEEKRIAKLFDEGAFKIAEALDGLAKYTWHTAVYEYSAKCPEDAAYLAECDSRRDYGKPLDVLCIERLPTEYQSEIRWRVTMREREEEDVQEA